MAKCAIIETIKILHPVTSEMKIPSLGGIFNVSVFPRFNDNGEFVGTVQIMRDITEHKQAEKEIREMASIVESSVDAIIGQTPQGIITSWNPGAEKIYGYTAEEMIGKNISTLTQPNRIDKTQLLLEKILHEEHIEYVETIHTTKSGNDINVSLAISPIRNEHDKIIGAATISRDITSIKILEEKLKMTYKMSSLGRMTAGVFHEILNPLNIISSYAQLLLSQGKWSSKTEEDLRRILEEVDRIVKITDGLLRFARRKGPNVENVNINSLLEKIIDIVVPEMKLKNIVVLKKFDEKLPTVMVNSDELRQVFLNLIQNAGYAMPDGGKLTISTQSIKKQKKHFVRIIFTDTGCGIPEKYIDKVFEPFFTNKKEGEGTGLGLSISYGIVENHGGKLSVESEEGKGATFTVDLPTKE